MAQFSAKLKKALYSLAADYRRLKISENAAFFITIQI